ncbi:MAG: nitronate monooxygenase [Pseudohongiellaceae bacterium]
MLHTPLCDLLGCRHPVLLAGMGGVSRHALAAAVANAGGFAKLGMVRESVERIRNEVNALRQATDRPFAVNLIPAATDSALLDAQVRACIELRVPFVELFWDVDTALIRHLKDEGIGVLHQVGDGRDAEKAVRAGADVLIAQGVEAGGHVRGTRGTLNLVADLSSRYTIPVVASGGIASGPALMAALVAGAQGVNLGTAFLATDEANAHAHHKQRICDADSDETLYTRLFSLNWHEPAPVRVLPNRVTRGEYGVFQPGDTPQRIGEQDGQAVYRFSTDSPLAGAAGELDDMALYAGQGCGEINTIMPAAERLEELLQSALTSAARE